MSHKRIGGTTLNTLRILDWIVEVDKEKTRSVCAELPQISDDENCNCIHCRNWVEACSYFSEPVNVFFGQLGIDPTKEGEISWVCVNDDGSHLYQGFYHFVGRLIEGPDCMVPFPFGNEEFHGHNIVLQSLTNELRIGFTEKISLRPGDETFPEPILQLEFNMDIPWVLENP
jgi:hypothetical protein